MNPQEIAKESAGTGRGKAKAIGPIVHSPGITMQAPRLALMERLKRARALAEAL